MFHVGSEILPTLKTSDGTYDAGTIAVSASGKVKKSGSVTIDGVKYTIKDYFIESAEDKESDLPVYEGWTEAHNIADAE